MILTAKYLGRPPTWPSPRSTKRQGLCRELARSASAASIGRSSTVTTPVSPGQQYLIVGHDSLGASSRRRSAAGFRPATSSPESFLICTFWLADNLALQGRDAEACEKFERVLALRNDVGLLSQEYDPVARQLVGNFPQTFSHIGLVNTARNLSRHGSPAEDRPGRGA